MPEKDHIYVALSGGVDSATVAALLVTAGYHVTGVYMKNWSENFGLADNCPWQHDIEDVKAVAEHLSIPWEVYNFEREYKERILDYFFAEYQAGRTPNPDILCNNLVKFDLCAKRAFEEGATHLATGHYARRQSNEGYTWEVSGELGLFTAYDAGKDQDYFLQRLSADQLQKALFPLGNMSKTEVRLLAKHFGLPNAEKKDSQGICFVGDIDIRQFIRKQLHTKPGPIIDIDTNERVGEHQGLWFYTIGQRQGLGIGGAETPYFVIQKAGETNTLFVGKGHNHLLLKKKSIIIGNLREISMPIASGVTVYAAIRYREKPIPVTVAKSGDGLWELTAQGDYSFWAPAAGQSALLYADSTFTEDKPVQTRSVPELLKLFTTGQIKRQLRYTQVLGGGIIT